MATLIINDNLNVRTMGKYFKNTFKSADYSDNVTIEFPNESTLDLAGLQILYAIKKELNKNGKNLTINGLDNLFIEYLNNNN